MDVVIIGAGFAGAATAAALVERGVRSVVVLEAEAVYGHHGSGRNAAMARRVIGDPVLTALATDSVRRIDDLAERFGRPLRDERGGLLIGSGADIDALIAATVDTKELAAQLICLDRTALAARVPALAGAAAEVGVLSPTCGVVDIHALLSTYLEVAKGAGVQLHLRHDVIAIETSAGRVAGVRTADRRWACDMVVNAAGFRVNAVAALAGVAPLRFDPVRRHLFVTAAWEGLDASWPFVWDVTDHVYFRPEGAGLLLCACDQTSWPPQDPPTDPAVREQLAERFSVAVPALAGVRPTRGWAGLRVMTPDHRFVIGRDPELDGFFWVAGLGGHGMTTSAGVGAIAAAGIVDGALPAPYATAFSPGRATIRS